MRKFTLSKWSWLFAATVALIITLYIIGVAITWLFWAAVTFMVTKFTLFNKHNQSASMKPKKNKESCHPE